MPSVIDELTMTLKLDPAGFKEGVEQAKTSGNQLLQQILATLQAIEARTTQSADRLTEIQKSAAAKTTTVVEDEAAKQATALEKSEKAKADAIKKHQKDSEDAAKQAAQTHAKHAKEMEDGFKRTGDSIRKVAGELLAFMGISMSVAAMENLFMGLNKANAQAGYLSKSLNMDVEALTEFQGAVARMGGTREGATSAAERVSAELAQFRLTGQSNLPSQARELFDTNLLHGGAGGGEMNASEMVTAFGKYARERNLTGVQLRARLTAMGLESLINPVLTEQRDPGAMVREQEQQRRTGNVTSPKAAADSEKFVNSLKLTQDYMGGISKTIQEHLTPAITSVLDRINAWMKLNGEWLNSKIAEWVDRVAKAIVQLADDIGAWMTSGGMQSMLHTIGEVAGAANSAAEALGGWGNVVATVAEIWIGGKVLGMIASMFRMTGALGALSLAAGVANAALEVLAMTWLGNKMGQNDTEKRAEMMGYTEIGKGTSEPKFTKDGETIDWHEMQRRQGYGEYGQTMMQSFGFNRPPMPGEPGGPPLGRPRADAGGAGGAAVVGEPLVARGTLAGNQAEAYNAATGAGLSDSSARALVANMSGESLSNPGDVHWDGSHYAHGTVQWDDVRSAKIKEHFGKMPNEMSVAEQTRAAIWEMQNNPAYKKTWDALQGSGSTEDKIRTLVSNYERPANTEAASAQRIRHLKGLPDQFSSAPATQIAARTPLPLPPRPPLVASPAAAATLATPPAGTTLAGSNAARRDDFATGLPVPAPIGASAAAEGFQMASNSSNDNSQSSETHIGNIHVHTAATDAPAIGRSIRGELQKYDYVQQADPGVM